MPLGGRVHITQRIGLDGSDGVPRGSTKRRRAKDIVNEATSLPIGCGQEA